MINILALGFYCDIYKKSPNVRLFLNDTFIDEFDIDPFSSLDAGMPSIKLYQINLVDAVGTYNIKLQIKNNDSNYNNGFMTKSTLIKLYTFSLFNSKNTDYVYTQLKKFSTDKSIQYSITNLKHCTTWQDVTQEHKLENAEHSMIGGSGTFNCTVRRSTFAYAPLKIDNVNA